KTCVVGVPKTIDGDLKNEAVEISFGFDTACKIYCETIGNICKDALSAKKYTFFIKLMGRSASHITLECALQTRPNLALIGEEALQKKQTLHDVVQQITDVVEARSKSGKDYGVILIPEGLIEFLVDVKALVKELNRLLVQKPSQPVEELLSHASKECFLSLPKRIAEQLLLDRDPHGNVQVSKIETERLLMLLVEQELKNRLFSGAFSPVSIFCGYEGRSALPSNFDATYCYNLGRTAASLIQSEKTGYMATLCHLTKSADQWRVGATPILSMLHIEERHGVQKAVIQKALVELNKKPFQYYETIRESCIINDNYRQPGPIQFFGAKELTDSTPMSLQLESKQGT
ncbi:MAG TPA: diphosphate--fructose-6-phosphate 1-phosphotransferase, partial [Chlamydiales bacterium]|nr:diphosphate--fructose-6-phosphate 1-phosphotransferase [Chlamydiales bacterium]